MRLRIDIRTDGASRHPIATIACTMTLTVALTLAAQVVTGNGRDLVQDARTPVGPSQRVASLSDDVRARDTDRVSEVQALVEGLKAKAWDSAQAQRTLAPSGSATTVSQLTDRVNAMQLAMLESLRLGTGRIASTPRDTIGDGPVATDADPRRLGRAYP